LRKVLDTHALTIQTAQLQRHRHYDNEIQHFDCLHPNQWAYVEQYDLSEYERVTGIDTNDIYERNDKENEIVEESVMLTSEDRPNPNRGSYNG
jgi:hypothetical protein